MGYVIEGTISELTVKDNDCHIKITGTEGYAIKLGGEIYNVFCPENMEAFQTSVITALITPNTMEMRIEESLITLVSSAITSGKRVRVFIEENKGKDGQDKIMPPHISAFTLLAH